MESGTISFVCPSRQGLACQDCSVRCQRLWDQTDDLNNGGFLSHRNPLESEDDPDIPRPHVGATRKHLSADDKLRMLLRARRRGKHCKYGIVGARDLRLHGSLSYATSPYANMLSALTGLGNSRVFVGFSPETLMVQERNGRAFSLRFGGFSPKLEGWPIFPTRFNALI